MSLNHEAIFRAYPNCRVVDDSTGAFDADGNPVVVDKNHFESAPAENETEAS